MQKADFQARQARQEGEIHLAYRWKWAVSAPPALLSQPVGPRAALSFIGLNRQSIQQPCMKDEGMRQAVNDEEPKIKGLTPFSALMAITSPDSSSKMRLIIRTDPFKEDWPDLMPSQITHKYLLRIKTAAVRTRAPPSLSVVAHRFPTGCRRNCCFKLRTVTAMKAMLCGSRLITVAGRN